MCHHIENLARTHRTQTELMNGRFISPSQLDQRFSSLSREDRGMIVDMVLKSISQHQRGMLFHWTEKSTKARPVPKGHSELMIFFAIAAATPENGDLKETVNLIRNKQSAIGVLIGA